jgi:hypothetical protein
LTPVFAKHLEAQLRQAGINSQASFAATIRSRMRKMLSDIKVGMKDWRDDSRCVVPHEFQHDDLKDHRGKHLVDAYQATLLRRTEQPLFLLRAMSQCGTLDDDAIDQWLRSEVIGPFEQTIRRIVGYLDGVVTGDRPQYELLDTAEHECVVLLQECSAVDIVGRYDGDNVRYREAHRRNFNQLFIRLFCL